LDLNTQTTLPLGRAATVFPTAAATFNEEFGLILQGLSHLYSFDGQVFAVKVHQERTKRIQKTVLSY
jgi:hypothetical protein